MSVELEEIRDFLAAHEPFRRLPEVTLAELPQTMEMTYVPRGETIITRGEVNDYLYIIRSGAVDVLGEEEVLLDRREPGRNFGYSTLVGEPECRYSMIAVEDTLLLVLPRDHFTQLAEANPDVERYFSTLSRRIAHAAREWRDDPAQDVLSTPVSTMISEQTPVLIESTATITEAARTMVEKNVSSILVTDNKRLSGILTDKDLRVRVVAAERDSSHPVTAVMTADPLTLTPDALAFEAMLVMAEHNIHHLPVCDHADILGVVTSGDISRLLQVNPVFLTAELSRRSRAELKDTYHRAGDAVARLIDRGASFNETSKVLTTVADALVRRLIELFEEDNGPSPVDYCFVVVGSQGRVEMGPASDQDNALILADDYDEEVHGDYIERLATFVCQGLADAGQALCPGEMMAMNPQWRMTKSAWLDTFWRWITAPEPDALLNTQIYFDMRGVAGNLEMAEEVHAEAVARAQGSQRLHAHLAALAARRDPPLGFFRGFVVERGGEYAKTLDVKKGGTAGLVQMARLYAIKAGLTVVGTRDRFRQAAGLSLTQQAADNLIDVFDYLSNLTLKHQSQQLKLGKEANYHIDPEQLNALNRHNLRDSFQILKKMQNALATAHPVRNI